VIVSAGWPGKAGLEVVALTDHDTLAGLPDASAAAAEAGVEVEVVAGVEISCLLGYFVDPGNQPLIEELARIRNDRESRAIRMVAAGVVGEPDEAFTPEWIGDGGRADVPKHVLTAERAIGLVRAAGGVAVLAHPRSVKRRTFVTDEQFAGLVGAGLAGIEVDHPEHEQPIRAQLRELAAKLGVVATGASDFHGDRSPVRLGENTTPPEVLAALRDLSA
jgi:3',5'-nucleoside bisphosphate phosphatase